MLYSKSDLEAIIAKGKWKSSHKKMRYLASTLHEMTSSMRRTVCKRKPKRKKARNMHRTRGFALHMLSNGELSDSNFQRMFRLDRLSFDEILEKLDAVLVKDYQKALNRSGSPISNTCRLAVTLRWLAGASYLDLCWAWGVSTGTFYSADRGPLWPTIQALDEMFTLGCALDNIEYLDELSDGFEKHSGGIMKGCVMAIDGLLVRTRAPTEDEVLNPKDWLCGKGGFAILAMAGADIKGRFVAATANYSGTTHDSTAWERSELHHAVDEGRLPEKYFIIGDEAYACKEQVLCPYSGRGLGVAKDAFNYYLSHSRQCIERAFGMLIQRWGIFWRKFRFAYERWSQVIILCMKLHNFCQERSLAIPSRRFNEDCVPGDDIMVAGNDDYLPDDIKELRQRSRCKKRFDITLYLESRGMRSPIHACGNSRA